MSPLTSPVFGGSTEVQEDAESGRDLAELGRDDPSFDDCLDFVQAVSDFRYQIFRELVWRRAAPVPKAVGMTIVLQRMVFRYAEDLDVVYQLIFLLPLVVHLDFVP